MPQRSTLLFPQGDRHLFQRPIVQAEQIGLGLPHAGDDVAPARDMFRTPDMHGYITASYNPVKELSLALTGTYTGSMLIEHHAGMIAQNMTVKTPDFWDMGFKAAYDFKLYKSFSLQLNAGVQNIFNSFQNDFDSGADRDSGYIYGPTLPRTCFFGIKLIY